MIVHDRVYDSGEHCFHGEKYTLLGEQCVDESRKQELLDYGRTFTTSTFTPAMAKRKGGKKGLCLTSEEIALWNQQSLSVQRSICKYKVDTYEEVQQDLLKSGTSILIHPAMRCRDVENRFWEGRGIVVDGKVTVLGQNQLGNLWMSLR